ncbi:MAG: hypothetical protein ACREP6_16075 [Candidatus Binataceae bacterium]
MDDFDRAFAQVANAPANTRFKDLVKLMELAGFQTKYGKKGDIAIFTYPAYHVRQTAAKPHHGPVLPVYVKDWLKAIEKVRLLQGNTDA